jgi:hypothetical protein
VNAYSFHSATCSLEAAAEEKTLEKREDLTGYNKVVFSFVLSVTYYLS